MNSILKNFLLVVLRFFSWVLQKAQEDRAGRIQAESELKEFKTYADKLMEYEAENDKKVDAINRGNLSNDDIASMLSQPLGESKHPPTSRDSKS